MHSLTYIIVATERERKITYSSADVCARKVTANPTCSFNKIDSIVIMFLDTSSHCQHVRIEDYILRTETDLLCKNTISPFANFYLPFKCIGLSFLVESHHDDCRPVLLDGTGVLNKSFFAFFQ